MKIDIDDQTTKKLNAMPAINGTPPEKLVEQIVSLSVTKDAHYWRQYEEDKATLEGMKKGDYIEHENMMNWLDDLATEKDA